MATIAGLRGSDPTQWATDERPKSFREMILWANPAGSAPITALLSRAKSEAVDDSEYSWYEETNNIVRMQVNGTHNTTTTDLVINVGSALQVKAGDVLLVETAETEAYTNELLRVSANPSVTTTIAVTRGAAGTTPASIPDDTWVMLMASAEAEGTDKPRAITRTPTKYNNYIQIFQDAYSITRSAEKTKFRTGDPLKNDKVRKMFDHSSRQELAFLFGVRGEALGGSDNQPIRYTGGLRWQLAQAYAAGFTHTVKLWTTTPTETTFLDSVYKMFDFNTQGGTDQRIVFCGNGFLNSLNKVALASSSTRINSEGTIKMFGMELAVWRIPQGTLFFRTHPLMSQHPSFTNSAFFLEFSGIRYRYLRDSDTRFMDNIQTPGSERREGKWVTYCGLEAAHLKTMSYHGNFVA